MYKLNKRNTYEQIKRGQWYYMALRSIVTGKILKVYKDTKTSNFDMADMQYKIWKKSESEIIAKGLEVR